MGFDGTEKIELTDAVKAAIVDAGIPLIRKESNASDDIEALKDKAQAMAEELQRLLDSGKLDDPDAQRLNAVLVKLRGALQAGTVSREALATALSEATTVICATDGGGKSLTIQQRVEQLWQQIDQYNNDIDDDFEKMRKAGVVFNSKLWEKHKQLSEFLQTHPHDIDKQKELDLVDDALLLQAEPQLKQCSGADVAYEDAKEKSKDRHQVVDHDLLALEERNTILNSNADVDWQTPAQSENPKGADKISFQDVTINDVSLPNGSQSSLFICKRTYAPEQNLIFKECFHLLTTPQTLDWCGFL